MMLFKEGIKDKIIVVRWQHLGKPTTLLSLSFPATPFIIFHSYSAQPPKFIQMDNTWDFCWQCCIVLFLNWAISIFTDIKTLKTYFKTYHIYKLQTTQSFWWKGIGKKEQERINFFKKHDRGNIWGKQTDKT